MCIRDRFGVARLNRALHVGVVVVVVAAADDDDDDNDPDMQRAIEASNAERNAKNGAGPSNV